MRVQTSVVLASVFALALPSCAPDFAPEEDGLIVPPLDNSLLADAGVRAIDASLDASFRTSVDASPPTGCDFRGSYLVTERFFMDVLGAKQVVHNWFQVELAQAGEELTFVSSVACGASIRGRAPLALTMDDSAAWSAYAAHASYEGRKGRVVRTSAGCEIAIDRHSVVRGATVDAYRDLEEALPTLAQPASGSSPGWEDWDDDGNPGITVRLTGVASGEMYVTARTWTAYAGVVSAGSTRFGLSLDWGMTRSLLGSYAPLISAEPSRDPDDSEQIVELAKLTESAVDCARMRALAPTLTPNASRD